MKNEKLELKKKNHVFSTLIYYLKHYENFLYFSNNDPKKNINHISKQFYELIFRSKRHLSELEPSAVYEIEKYNNQYFTSSLQYPKNATTFETYNKHSIDRLFIAYSISRFCAFFNNKGLNVLRYDSKKEYSIAELISLLIETKNMIEVELTFMTIHVIYFDILQNFLSDLKSKISTIQVEYEQLLSSKCFVQNDSQYEEKSQTLIDEITDIINYYNSYFDNAFIKSLVPDLIRSIMIQLNNQKFREPIDLVALFLKFNNKDINKSLNLLLEDFDDDTIKILTEFKEQIIDYLKRNNIHLKLEETYIFYPAYFYSNLIDSQSRLVEINIFKYHQEKETLSNNKKRFYKMFEDLNIHTDIQDYFQSDAVKFNPNIAYFDPFILTDKKFYDRFYELITFLNSDYDVDLNQNLIIYDLLHLLNVIQFNIIEVQQQNLFNALLILSKEKEQKLKNLSLFEYYFQKILNDTISYCNINDSKVFKNKILLEIMLANIHNIKNYSNITIDELGFKNCTDMDLKNSAKHLLNNILRKLNKDKNYSLKNLFESKFQLIENFFKEKNIQLEMKHKYFIRDLIKHIIDPYSKNIDTNNTLKATIYFNSKFQEQYDFFDKRPSLLKKFMERKISNIQRKQ